MREEQTEAEAVEAALERELDSSSAARLAFGSEDVEDDFKMVVEQHLQAVRQMYLACISRVPRLISPTSRLHRACISPTSPCRRRAPPVLCTRALPPRSRVRSG